jgi:hypothetical protein
MGMRLGHQLFVMCYEEEVSLLPAVAYLFLVRQKS